jgi:hypothetical protein
MSYNYKWVDQRQRYWTGNIWAMTLRQRNECEDT